MMNNSNNYTQSSSIVTSFINKDDYISEDDHQYQYNDEEDFNYDNDHHYGGETPLSPPRPNTNTFRSTRTSNQHYDSYYTDESKSNYNNNDHDDQNGSASNNNSKKVVPPPFPVKLHGLLQDANRLGFDNIISWQYEGVGQDRSSCHPFSKNIHNKSSSALSELSESSFKIHDSDRFANEIMPKYFAQCTKLKSFHRQLNIYGFKRIHVGPFKGGYSHALFQRLCPELCEHMARKTTSRARKGKPSASPSSSTERRQDRAAKNSRSIKSITRQRDTSSGPASISTKNETRDDIMVLEEETEREKGFCSTNNDIRNNSIEDDTMMMKQGIFFQKDDTQSIAAQDKMTTSRKTVPATTLPFSFSFEDTFTRRYQSSQPPSSNMNGKVIPPKLEAVYSDFIPPAYSPLKYNRPSQTCNMSASNTTTINPTQNSFYPPEDSMNDEEEEEADLLSFLDQYILGDGDDILSLPQFKKGTLALPQLAPSLSTSLPKSPPEGEQRSQTTNHDGSNNSSTNTAAVTSTTAKHSRTSSIPISISNEIFHDNTCFPYKLYRVLQDAEKDGFDHIISWVDDGNAFKVHNYNDFVEEIMPNYFDQTKYESFRRQLNMYGFERISKGDRKGVISHSCFMRSVPSLCQFIFRQPVKGTGGGGGRRGEKTTVTTPSLSVSSTVSTGGSSSSIAIFTC